MIGWVLVAAGTLLASAGVLAGVSAAAVRRVHLYRWATGGLPGAGAAAVLLAAPGRVLRAAHGLTTGGVILSGLGVAELVHGLPPILGVGAVALIALPILLAAVYAVPRAMGRRWPQRIVRRTVPWLRRLAVVFAPFFPRALQPRARAALDARLRGGERDEDLDRDELPVLAGVLAFSERPIREVMTPRTEIVAVREGASLDEVGRLFSESGYSRIPLYRDSLDNIVGMIYAFDLLKVTPGAELPLRPVTSAPGSKPCADLLFEMQRERRQFAVALDEYGGTAGIVTFEDLLEELVGEIFEEYDWRTYSNGSTTDLVEANGATPTEEIAARFEVSLPEDAETIGGLLARAAGRIPRTGERYVLGGLEFDILAATPVRLERVLVRRGPVPSIPLDRPERSETA
jgi:CBS domain containing-hemolysin-like protein